MSCLKLYTLNSPLPVTFKHRSLKIKMWRRIKHEHTNLPMMHTNSSSSSTNIKNMLKQTNKEKHIHAIVICFISHFIYTFRSSAIESLSVPSKNNLKKWLFLEFISIFFSRKKTTTFDWYTLCFVVDDVGFGWFECNFYSPEWCLNFHSIFMFVCHA